jgi:hypothetical protein
VLRIGPRMELLAPYGDWLEKRDGDSGSTAISLLPCLPFPLFLLSIYR